MAMGHGGAASLASGCTTVKARHLGVRGGLADEDDPRRIEVELPFKPPLARRVPRAAALFGGVRRLFLRVILRRLKNRQSVPIADIQILMGPVNVCARPQSLRNGISLSRARYHAAYPPREHAWLHAADIARRP